MPQEQTVEPELRVEAAPSGQERLETLDMAVTRHILRALEISGGKISGKGGAAEILDLHPNTLRARMQKLGIRHDLPYMGNK